MCLVFIGIFWKPLKWALVSEIVPSHKHNTAVVASTGYTWSLNDYIKQDKREIKFIMLQLKKTKKKIPFQI